MNYLNSILSILMLLAVQCLAQSEIPDTPKSLQGIINVNPRDMLLLRKTILNIDEAKNSPISEIPRFSANTDISQLTLTSGEQMPEVFSLFKQPTSIEFVDVTGEPWPVREYLARDPFIMVKHSKAGAGNALWVSAEKNFGQAVISVFLKDLPTAISVLVKADNEQFNKTKTIKIMRLGVNSKINRSNVQMAEEAGQEVDEFMMSASHGIRPYGYTTLVTSNENVHAWSNANEVLIYSNIVPFLPNPIRITGGSTHGWRAYRLPLTSRIQMINEFGSVVDVVLKSELPDTETIAKTEKH